MELFVLDHQKSYDVFLYAKIDHDFPDNPICVIGLINPLAG